MAKGTVPPANDNDKGKANDAGHHGSTPEGTSNGSQNSNIYRSPKSMQDVSDGRTANATNFKQEPDLFAAAYGLTKPDSSTGRKGGTNESSNADNASVSTSGSADKRQDVTAKAPLETTSNPGTRSGKETVRPSVQPASEGAAGTQRPGVHGDGINSAQAKPGEVLSVSRSVTDAKPTADGNQQISKTSPPVADRGANPQTRSASAQGLEQPASQAKASGVNQGDMGSAADSTGTHKPDASPAAVGAAYMPPGRKDDANSSNTATRPAVAETTAGNANNGAKVEGRSEGKPLVTDGSVNTLGSQPRADLKSLQAPATSPVGQQKFDSQKGESQPVGQGKFDPAKGSDAFSTQGSTNAAVRQDGARIADTKVEGGKSVEPQGSRDAGTLRDPKSAGVANEVFGQKTEAGQRGEVSPSAGAKPDSRTVEQITKGIESRVNEGPKPPSGADSRGPTSSEGAGGSRQPGTTDGTAAGTRQPVAEAGGKSQGIADGAQPGVKQTNPSDVVSTGKQPSSSDGASSGTSSTIRQPMSDVGDKGTSGGGGSVTAETTKKIDVAMAQGGKAEGQTGSSGMGGGSSAPIDRAPHAPFKVEEAQPSGAKSEGGAKGDIGGKGDLAGVGKNPAAGDGTRFDSGEIRGNQPGARFDTGETRGNQPGARFDTGEIKDGRSGITTGGKSGDAGGVIGAESGTIKGADVSGVKASTGGGQGIGGSSGPGSADAGILGDKRQPSMFPDGPAGPGGKPVKPGDGIASGQVSGDDSVPFVLPGGFGGKDGGRRQSDQMFGDKTKGGEASGNKPEPGAAAGKAEAGQKAESGQKAHTGQKADAGISAAMAGQVGAGASEVGNVLKNFAQTVLSDGKSGATNDGPGQKTRVLDSTVANSDTKVVSGAAAADKSSVAMPGSAPAGDKVSDVTGARVVGPGAAPSDASKKTELGTSGHGSADILGVTSGDDEGGTSIDDFNLPEVDLLGDVDEKEKVEELTEVDESEEAKLEDEMHYELALGLQLYTSIAEAPYGAYHYLTREGDTVESVAREIVGDERTAPLVFSLNKEHILASTEYGVHPFKVGVMVQLPTPRDLKHFFGGQT